MLPVSGAAQLKTSGDQTTRPIVSQSGAYSMLLSPAPCVVGRVGQDQVPQPRGPRLLLQLGDERRPHPAIAAIELLAVALLVGIDVRVHERPEPRQVIPGLPAELKVHGLYSRRCPLPRWRTAS